MHDIIYGGPFVPDASAGLVAIAAGNLWLANGLPSLLVYLILVPAAVTTVLVALDACCAQGIAWRDGKQSAPGRDLRAR
jgi:hypothetical protein